MSAVIKEALCGLHRSCLRLGLGICAPDLSALASRDRQLLRSDCSSSQSVACFRHEACRRTFEVGPSV